MSLRTRINGFTAWVNLRLSPAGHLMHNVLVDLLKGYNMKVLLESKDQIPVPFYHFMHVITNKVIPDFYDTLFCDTCLNLWAKLFVQTNKKFCKSIKEADI